MNNLKKIKLLLIAPVPPPFGGIANWTRLMLENLDDNGVEYEVLNIAPKKRQMDGRTLFHRIFVSGLDMLIKYNQLKKKLRNKSFDVIHLTTSGQFAIIRDLLFLSLAKKTGINSCYHIRFGKIPVICEQNTLEWKLFRKAALLASTVIAIDKRTYCSIKTHLPNIDLELIPNPILLSELPDQKNTSTKKIAFLGWVVKAKGIEELLSAWQKVYKLHNDWELDIIGPYHDDYLEELKEKFVFNGVNILGEKKHDEAMELLNKSEIFILPSYSEGCPNVMLEAMGLQKAIIATDVGAIPEMLSGECGVLIEKQSSAYILDSLHNLIENEELRNTFAANAYNKVLNEYDFDIILKKYINIWMKRVSK
jgi:glycosyltransferase involved in cell wall biosynthesis